LHLSSSNFFLVQSSLNLGDLCLVNGPSTRRRSMEILIVKPDQVRTHLLKPRRARHPALLRSVVVSAIGSPSSASCLSNFLRTPGSFSDGIFSRKFRAEYPCGGILRLFGVASKIKSS
jgi:hypothetical protein